MSRMAEVNMVVVGGVRYRPEDAPKQAETDDVEGKAAEKPNKARRPRNKSVE